VAAGIPGPVVDFDVRDPDDLGVFLFLRIVIRDVGSVSFLQGAHRLGGRGLRIVRATRRVGPPAARR